MNLPQMAEVNTHVAKGLLAELTEQGISGPALSMVVQLRLSVEGARVALSTGRVAVLPPVGVNPHVSLKVVPEAEAAATNRATVRKPAPQVDVGTYHSSLGTVLDRGVT